MPEGAHDNPVQVHTFVLADGDGELDEIVGTQEVQHQGRLQRDGQPDPGPERDSNHEVPGLCRHRGTSPLLRM